MPAIPPWHRRVLPLLTAVALVACNLDNPGDPPPAGLINFPTALALGPHLDGDGAPRHLLVVNSNFDLRYSNGSLQAFDLDALDAEIARCPSADDAPEDCEFTTDGILQIDPQQRVDGQPLLAGEILVDPFGIGISVGPATGDDAARRVYVPVRSESFLGYAEIDPSGELTCGDGRSCTSGFQRGAESVVNDRDLELPGEPIAVASGALSDWNPALTGARQYVLLAHRGGSLSLFVDDDSGQLALTHVLEGLLPGTSGLLLDPQKRVALLTGSTKLLQRVGVAVPTDDPTLARAYYAGLMSLRGAGTTGDLRSGLLIPGADGKTPSRALLLGRQPAAYIETQLGPDARNADELHAERTVEVGNGPMRVAVGTLTTTDGQRLSVAAVACFDGRQVFIIDRDSGRPLSVLPNFSGPFELVVDGPRRRLYVADFRSSVVRIVALDGLLPTTDAAAETPRIVATIGRPRAVEELQ